MLVANLLALHLNLPLTDLEGLLSGRMISAGGRIDAVALQNLLSTKRRVLVVDDSVLGGDQLSVVKSRIDAADLPHDIQFAAPYIVSGKRHCVDFFIEELPAPRCFEWNLMHHKLFLSQTCMDIDGVLCRDPVEEQNDDGPKYECFLAEAETLYLPSHPVRWLVTSRLEKYRKHTEAWLTRHGVQYGDLLMMNYPDMASRRAAQAYASFKAEIYLKTKAWLFIESSLTISEQIAELTGYDVFCMDTREMIRPSGKSARRRKILDAPRNMKQQIVSISEKALIIPGGVGRRARRAYRKVFNLKHS